jgi:hypothetical protein
MLRSASLTNAGAVLAVRGSAMGCRGTTKARKHTELMQARR